jgi:hypothetical protein
MQIIVRAYQGEPLVRVAVYLTKNKVYAANPASIDRVQRGESYPVGFPIQDCFLFESDIYNELLNNWNMERYTPNELWSRLKTYAK